MRSLLSLLIPIVFFGCSHAQRTIEKTLQRFNSESVPYIAVDEALNSTNSVLLDTRKKEEFEVSHLENAIWVGYRKFSIDSTLIKIPEKDTPIIVYCSVGVRSEDIGEKLLKAGYTNVKNLYGGLFEWKNKANPVVDREGNETDKVHAFNKHWGKLLTNAQKVY